MDLNDIIDTHVHLYRTIEQERAGAPFPGRPDRYRWGTPDAVTSFLNTNGIAKVVFLNIMPTIEMRQSALNKLLNTLSNKQRIAAELDIENMLVKRIKGQNEWACSVGNKNARLIPFIGIQKILGENGIVDEVGLRLRNGAKGIKIHPGFNHFYPNDRVFWPFYEMCQQLRVPVISDSGFFPGDETGKDYGQPFHFTEVLREFPRLILVLAHIGGAFWDQRIELSLHYHNVYFDTAQGFAPLLKVPTDDSRRLSEIDAVRVMRKIGVERIMFGSDGPACDFLPQLEQILRLALTDEEKELILRENAKRILNI
jgi:uncharacterized protein